jgi:hypothetical protein
MGVLNLVSSSITGAYSLRKLNDDYSGPCVRVRIGSYTGSFYDIGFAAGGSLDAASLLANAGSNKAYVDIWYDQSGNGRDLVQKPDTWSDMAVIADAGAVKNVGGVPAIFTGDGGAENGRSTPGIAGLSVRTVCAVVCDQSLTSGNAAQTAICGVNPSGAGGWLLQAKPAANQWGARPGGGFAVAEDGWEDGKAVPAASIPQLANCINMTSGNNQSLHMLMSTQNVTITTDATQGMFFGRISINGWKGYLCEFIVWGEKPTRSDRQAWEDHAVGAYGITRLAPEPQTEITQAAPYWFFAPTKTVTPPPDPEALPNPLFGDYLTSTLSKTVVAAFSLRRLFLAYTGPLVRARNASTGAEADIYADDSGNLNEFAVRDLCSGANGEISVYYDQSGNSRHAASVQNNRPILWRGNQILRSTNGMRPVCRYDGSLGLEFAPSIPTTIGSAFTYQSFTGAADTSNFSGAWYYGQLVTSSGPGVFARTGTPNLYLADPMSKETSAYLDAAAVNMVSFKNSSIGIALGAMGAWHHLLHNYVVDNYAGYGLDMGRNVFLGDMRGDLSERIWLAQNCSAADASAIMATQAAYFG